jgi:hypothetical protein
VDGAAVGATVVLDVPATPAELLAFYQTELTARGWSATDTGPSGLQPSIQAVTQTFCQSERGPALSITISPQPPGPSDLRLNVDTLFPFQCANRPLPGAGAGLLPPLHPPTGLELLPSNPPQPIAGGKPALQATYAIARSTAPTATLERTFAQQLQLAGWTRRAGGAAGPVAWSTWSVPRSGDWQGLLLVLEGPSDGYRTIHVQVTTTAAPAP